MLHQQLADYTCHYYNLNCKLKNKLAQGFVQGFGEYLTLFHFLLIRKFKSNCVSFFFSFLFPSFFFSL